MINYRYDKNRTNAIVVPEDVGVLGSPPGESLHLQLARLPEKLGSPGPHEGHVLVPTLGPYLQVTLEPEVRGQSCRVGSPEALQRPLDELLVLLGAGLDVSLKPQGCVPASHLRPVETVVGHVVRVLRRREEVALVAQGRAPGVDSVFILTKRSGIFFKHNLQQLES